MQKIARDISKVVENVKGTADVFDGIVISGPSVTIEPNYNQLAQYGITPTDLQFQIQTALEGNAIGNIIENEKTTPIRMIYNNKYHLGIEDLNKLKVFLPNGNAIPITNLVTIIIKKGEPEIERENLQMMSVVKGRLNNRDLGTVMSDIQKKVGATIHLPSGYYIEYGGAYKDQQQSFKELLLILIASSLLVFGVILFLFRDFRVALIIILISVLGISGSYLLLFFTKTPLNVGSYTGIIMIVGIISENAIFSLFL